MSETAGNQPEQQVEQTLPQTIEAIPPAMVPPQQQPSHAKTHRWMYIPVIVLVVLGIGIAMVFSTSGYPAPTELVPVSVGGVKLMAGVMDSDAERARGLSGRPSLPHDEGLLFIFDTPGTYGFWMKEMNFPIDILWFDENKLLVDISPSIDPSTYPESFVPQVPAQYVLEANAGFVEEKKIKLGDQLTF